MNHLLSFFFVILLGIGAAVARDCPICHGRGSVKITMFGGYTISEDDDRPCPYCKKLISGTHYCTCPKCGGSGEVGGGDSDRNLPVNKYDLQKYLNPDEYLALENLQQLSYKGTKFVKAPCQLCNQTGICKGCKGTGIIFGDQFCPCLDGRCNSCRGRKYVYQEVPFTPEEKANIDESIRVFIKLALSRMK